VRTANGDSGDRRSLDLAKGFEGSMALTLICRKRLWLRQLHERMGITMVFVTLDQQEAFTLGHLLAVTNRRRIGQYGELDDMPTSREHCS
jgi:ABC-type sugar transport system ATPase subunit